MHLTNILKPPSTPDFLGALFSRGWHEGQAQVALAMQAVGALLLQIFKACYGGPPNQMLDSNRLMADGFSTFGFVVALFYITE